MIPASKKDFTEWLNGGDAQIATSTKGGLTHTARMAFLGHHGRVCQLCGWCKVNESIGYALVEIDHIDGYRFNNHVSNLRVVCPNCHSLTPTYRMLNRQ